MSRATTVGPSRPSESRAQTAPDGRRADADTARVAGTNVDTSRWTPSVWAGVEPVKLNTGVGYPYLDTGAAGIPQTAYLGQPTQLRPAAPMQLASGQYYQPWIYGPGAGLAPAPYWHYLGESWVRAPQGQLMGVPPDALAQGWEAGFIPEARKRSHRSVNLERASWTSRRPRRSHVHRRRQLLRRGEVLVKCLNFSAITAQIAWRRSSASSTA